MQHCSSQDIFYQLFNSSVSTNHLFNLQLHDSKRLHHDQVSMLREDAETRNAEHEVQTQHLQERAQYLSDQLQKTQGLLYDSEFSGRDMIYFQLL